MTFIQSSVDKKETVVNSELEFPALDVLHVGTETLPGGARLHHLKVEDESDGSPNKAQWEEHIDLLDREVSAHPEWSSPKLENGELDIESLNPASAVLYGEDSPSLREWAQMMRSSGALTNLYWPSADRFPGELSDEGPLLNGGLVDKNAQEYFKNGLDAVAIRTRARVLQQIMAKQLETTEGRDLAWTSLACGAAIPILEMSSRATKGDKNIHINLVDIDDHALQFAARLAAKKGLSEGKDYKVMKRHLIRDFIVRNNLVNEILPESQDMVDMIGIFEYFAKEGATKMLHNAYDLVRPGGSVVFANMLSNRPQKEFNQRCVGWPGLNMRSINDILEITESAGIDRNHVDVFVPQDGVYAVAQVVKPIRLES